MREMSLRRPVLFFPHDPKPCCLIYEKGIHDFFLSILFHSRKMDRFSRGEAFNHNGRLTIELHDEYEHQSNDIEYVVENVVQNSNTDSPSFESLRNEFNSIYENKCSCSSDTNGISSYEMCTECSHGGNYVSFQMEDDNRMELVLNKKRRSQDLIYECCDLCACPSTCQNRLVQFGPRKHLQIIRFPRKAFGLVTLKSIPQGAFICEYAGELLTKNEALRRIRRIDATNEMNYLICLNERSMNDGNAMGSRNKIVTYVDPSRIGNIGRYLNHSCDPNCEIISVRTNGSIPKLGKKIEQFSGDRSYINFNVPAIFAKQAIAPNQELCFDYGECESASMDNLTPSPNNRKPCYCGSALCRMYLPNLSIT